MHFGNSKLIYWWPSCSHRKSIIIAFFQLIFTWLGNITPLLLWGPTLINYVFQFHVLGTFELSSRNHNCESYPFHQPFETKLGSFHQTIIIIIISIQSTPINTRLNERDCANWVKGNAARAFLLFPIRELRRVISDETNGGDALLSTGNQMNLNLSQPPTSFGSVGRSGGRTDRSRRWSGRFLLLIDTVIKMFLSARFIIGTAPASPGG